MTRELFVAMIDAAERTIVDEWKLDWERVQLVSGGAAWADHVAVRLFKKHPSTKLTLHFPCRFLSHEPSPRFEDTGLGGWRQNPGRSANTYHDSFSRAIGASSLSELAAAVAHERVIVGTERGGFHFRNTKVAAQAQRMIALARGGSAAPESGGTLDTWSKCKGLKLHVALGGLLGAVPAAVGGGGGGDGSGLEKRKRDGEGANGKEGGGSRKRAK
ncbi:hypothetical protein DFJ73DRAFT_287720 [Zopfochytrium polystomum]|nr:hypothetical protein DFJ73DRAFT_287720 [Zopfochytrium polystomum]